VPSGAKLSVRVVGLYQGTPQVGVRRSSRCSTARRLGWAAFTGGLKFKGNSGGRPDGAGQSCGWAVKVLPDNSTFCNMSDNIPTSTFPKSQTLRLDSPESLMG